MGNILLDKTYACLAAAALGDAMGASVECWHYEAIREKYGVITELLPERGIYLKEIDAPAFHVTDDTYLRHLTCRAIIEKEGRITAYDLARAWLKEMDPLKTNMLDSNIFIKLSKGAQPRESGEGIHISITATLGILPVGIVNACDPMTAAMNALDVASLSQWRYGKEAAACIAAGVAQAFKQEATIENIIETCITFAGDTIGKRIKKAIQIAKKYNDPIEAIPEFYDKLLVDDGLENWIKSQPALLEKIGIHNISFSSDPLEMIPVSLAFFYLSKADPMKAIIGGVNFGRDCDGIAGFASALAGALTGSERISTKMVEKVNKASNFNLMEIARQLQVAIIKVAEDKKKVAEKVISMYEKTDN